MEYSKIISVAGLPGLFELISSKADGAIVRSLEDHSTRFISSRIHNFSHLESIEIYTSGDNVNLVEVFEAMKNSSEKLPEEKDAGGVRKYFEQVYPDMDFERVYNSDMKKIVKWFSFLNAHDIEIKLSVPEEMEEVLPEPVKEEPAIEEKPKAEKAKKTTKKKTEAPAKESVKKSSKTAAEKSGSKSKSKKEEKAPAAKKSAKKKK